MCAFEDAINTYKASTSAKNSEAEVIDQQYIQDVCIAMDVDNVGNELSHLGLYTNTPTTDYAGSIIPLTSNLQKI